jgi:hypothetical protein
MQKSFQDNFDSGKYCKMKDANVNAEGGDECAGKGKGLLTAIVPPVFAGAMVIIVQWFIPIEGMPKTVLAVAGGGWGYYYGKAVLTTGDAQAHDLDMATFFAAGGAGAAGGALIASAVGESGATEMIIVAAATAGGYFFLSPFIRPFMHAYTSITGFVWRGIDWLTGFADKVLCRIAHLFPQPCKGRIVYGDIGEWAAMMALSEQGLTDKERSALFNVLISNHQQLYFAPTAGTGYQNAANPAANFQSNCRNLSQLKSALDEEGNRGKSVTKNPWYAALGKARKFPGKTWGTTLISDSFLPLITLPGMQKQLAASTTIADGAALAAKFGQRNRALFGKDQSLEVMGIVGSPKISVSTVLQTPDGSLYSTFNHSGDMWRALKMITDPDSVEWLTGTPYAAALKAWYKNGATIYVTQSVSDTLVLLESWPRGWGDGPVVAPSTQWMVNATNSITGQSIASRAKQAAANLKTFQGKLDSFTLAAFTYFAECAGDASKLQQATLTLLVRDTNKLHRNSMVQGFLSAAGLSPKQMTSQAYISWFHKFYGITVNNQSNNNYTKLVAAWRKYLTKNPKYEEPKESLEPIEWIKPRHHTAQVGLIKNH